MNDIKVDRYIERSLLANLKYQQALRQIEKEADVSKAEIAMYAAYDRVNLDDQEELVNHLLNSLIDCLKEQLEIVDKANTTLVELYGELS